MLIPNHPADERLSALASHDPEAIDDAELTSHVGSCVRCTATVDELSGLRLALSELPDLAPDRPLRLLPPVDAPAEPIDRLGGWVRRFFAPVLASGAAVALVGLVGTVGGGFAPLSGQLAGPSADRAGTELSQPETEAAATVEAAASTETLFEDAGGDAGGEAGGGAPAAASSGGTSRESSDPLRTPVTADDDGRTGPSPLESQRSPWPMVLFTGVALMVGAVLLRWILVPRAG